MERLGAGLRLVGLAAFWLLAWAPLALYCAGAVAVNALRRPRQAIG